MQPELPVRVGRNLHAPEPEPDDAALVRLDEDRVRAGRDPQHLEAQRRHDVPLGQHDHRDPADDAVALRLDGEQAAPGGRVLDHGDVAQQPREVPHEPLCILAAGRDARLGQCPVEICAGLRTTGFAEHDARSLQRFGEHLVIGRQGPELVARCLVKIGKGLGRERGIEPVRLGKHHVEGDDDRTESRQPVDDLRDARARPGPLTELGISKALFVDIDDGHRPHRLHPWAQDLEVVEGPDAQFLHQGRIGDAQTRKAQQQQQADRARIAEPAREPSWHGLQSLHDRTAIARLASTGRASRGLRRHPPLSRAIMACQGPLPPPWHFVCA